MSIIIKGLDMPNTCGQCNLRAFDEWEDEYCTVLCSDIEDHTKRLDSCPLVEIPNPHGRIIDVDNLIPQEVWIDEMSFEAVDYDDIKDVPTILEEEKQECS